MSTGPATAPAAAAPATQPASAQAAAAPAAAHLAFPRNAYHVHLAATVLRVEIAANSRAAILEPLPGGMSVSAADAATLARLFAQLATELAPAA